MFEPVMQASPPKIKCNEKAIQDVWSYNLYEEFSRMTEVAAEYPFVSMDTEYPGVIAEINNIPGSNPLCFTTVVSNVNLLKLIQLGLSFFNAKGEQPPNPSTWQFNFRFNINLDLYSPDSISMLVKSGFVFQKYEEEGINHLAFAELFYSSNLLMNPRIRWITFHGSADFCYLLKMLINSPLPQEDEKFYPLLNSFFPRLYDLKYMVRDCRNLLGGLQNICDNIGIPREGEQHHAGSDSLITGKLFFRLLNRYFEDHLEDEKYCGKLYGLVNENSLSNLKNFYGSCKQPKLCYLNNLSSNHNNQKN